MFGEGESDLTRGRLRVGDSCSVSVTADAVLWNESKAGSRGELINLDEESDDDETARRERRFVFFFLAGSVFESCEE